MERENQILDRNSNVYKAAVITGLIGSFDENFWWWKIFLMLERAALAILIHFEVSSWWAVGVSGS